MDGVSRCGCLALLDHLHTTGEDSRGGEALAWGGMGVWSCFQSYHVE